MWNWVKNISKHVVKKLLHKQSKVYTVHDEPLTKEECEKAKISHGFEGAMYAIGKHVDHYAKTESPSSQKCPFLQRIARVNAWSWKIITEFVSPFFSSISLGDSDNEMNLTEI